jgi:hypothetical protein
MLAILPNATRTVKKLYGDAWLFTPDPSWSWATLRDWESASEQTARVYPHPYGERPVMKPMALFKFLAIAGVTAAWWRVADVDACR